MKRTLSFLIILAILFTCPVVLTGCSDEKASEYPVTVGGVTVEQEPLAIVVLNPSVADIVSYIDYDYKMVGRSIDCDQDFLSIVPSVGTPDNPAVDTIVNKGADLVIADSTLPDKVRKKIEAEGVTVVVLDPASDFDSLRELYISLGTLLGGSATGSKKGEKSYNELIDTLGQFKSSATGIVKTAVYLYLDKDGQLCTFTKGSMEQSVFNYSGATNVFANQEEALVDAAQLRMASPTCIFYDDYAVIDCLRNNEKLKNLRALKENRFCQLPLENFSRYGSTCELTVYKMVAFLNDLDKATDDEATPDQR